MSSTPNKSPARVAADGEEFHDFSISSALEAFAASIEHCIHNWITKDIKRHQQHLQSSTISDAASTHTRLTLNAHLRHRLPFRNEDYRLTAHIQQPVDDATINNNITLGDYPHKAQTWFGNENTSPFLILEPGTYSGRVLEEVEAHTLASAASIALAHLKCSWPLLIPVYHALRDGLRGIAIDSNSGRVVKYESDSVHGTSIREDFQLAHVQLQLFSKSIMGSIGSSSASELCLHAAEQVDEAASGLLLNSSDVDAGIIKAAENAMKLRYTTRNTYIVPDYSNSSSHHRRRNKLLDGAHLSVDNDDETVSTSAEEEDSESELEIVIDDWDTDAPWRPWATHEDPLSCLEVDLTWINDDLVKQQGRMVPYLTSTASHWRLAALSSGYERDDGTRRLIAFEPVDQRRKFLRLHSIITGTNSGGTNNESSTSPKTHINKTIDDASLCGMLLSMVKSFDTISTAHAIGQLMSREWWIDQMGYVPRIASEAVLQDAIRDLFQSPQLPPWNTTTTNRNSDGTSTSSRQEQLGIESTKSMVESLASRFALHAMLLGNPRAVANLWQRFLRELRFINWEGQQRLPRMTSDESSGNISSSLLHQKLQLLDLCISMKQQATAINQDRGTSSASDYVSLNNDDGDNALNDGTLLQTGMSRELSDALAQLQPDDIQPISTTEEEEQQQHMKPVGVKHILGDDEYLLHHPTIQLNVPMTQELPAIMTQDMLSSSSHNNTSLQTALLLSDMQAFKAANPGCCFEDFIRWHSPKDWVLNTDTDTYELSTRMKPRMKNETAAADTQWMVMWEAARAIPASQQKALFQASLEGERVLHFLEVVPPAVLYAELMVLGVDASIALLECADSAALPAVKAELEALKQRCNSLLSHSIAAYTTQQEQVYQQSSSSEEEDGLLIDDNTSTDNKQEQLTKQPSALHNLFTTGMDIPTFRSCILHQGLYHVESTVVAAQSLLHRLSILSSDDTNNDDVIIYGMANKLINAALQGFNETTGEYGTVLSIPIDSQDPNNNQVAILNSLMTGGFLQNDDGSNTSSWVTSPYQTEWLIEILSKKKNIKVDNDVEDQHQQEHRMYIKRLLHELRVATVIRSPSM